MQIVKCIILFLFYIYILLTNIHRCLDCFFIWVVLGLLDATYAQHAPLSRAGQRAKPVINTASRRTTDTAKIFGILYPTPKRPKNDHFDVPGHLEP